MQKGGLHPSSVVVEGGASRSMISLFHQLCVNSGHPNLQSVSHPSVINRL